MKIVDDALKGIAPTIHNIKTIVVGMSGGVDSSVAAALLQELGCNVIGLFMKNWEEETCPAVDDANDVAQVARTLGIPHYVVSFAKEYKNHVFEEFLHDLRAGYTPNPDILCNREVKFKHLLTKALDLGGDALATGHYAKVFKDEYWQLHRADDHLKDQTYFLYTATQSTLAKTLFPLAQLKKTEVRALAKAFSLSVSEKKDSTGICFIGERNFRQFLKPYIGTTPGPIYSVEGKNVGTHIGLPYYTIGQRKGLGIGGSGSAWFVVGKDVENNRLIIAQGKDHPALFSQSLVASSPHWILGKSPTFPLSCTAKIRYRQEDQHCIVTEKQGDLLVNFSSPQRAITPRQAIVLYQDKVCLGGAFIQSRGPSLFEQSFGSKEG